MKSRPLSNPRSAALALLAGGLAGCSAEDATRAPLADTPVLMILADTLRADALPSGGAPLERAPYLARLADESATFSEARSTSSWTAPSTASLFTGLYPNAHGVEQGLFLAQHAAERERTETLNIVPGVLETLPERFRAAGYRTFGLSENPNITEQLGFDAGFDQLAYLPYDGGDALDRAVDEWLATGAAGEGERWFAYLQLMDPHQPYYRRESYYLAPPTGGSEAADPQWVELRALYDSEIGHLSARTERLIEAFDAKQRALVVFLADHGEEFGEHGRQGHWYTLYDELLRVPLYFRAPDGLDAWEPGPRDTTVSLVDVLPTLVELCGLPGGGPADGLSLAGLLADPADPTFPQRDVFAMRHHPISHGETDLTALVRWGRKVIYDGRLRSL
ncbi:MAG: sulfatase, partial [Planctomycetota bacterium]